MNDKIKYVVVIGLLIFLVLYMIWIFSLNKEQPQIQAKISPVRLTGQLENTGYELCMMPGREQILNKRPILFPCGNSQNFIWQIVDDRYIKNVKTDLCMIPSTEPSALNVVLDKCPSISNITPMNALSYPINQIDDLPVNIAEWDILYQADNSFQLKNKKSGKCLDIVFDENGPDTTQNPCITDPNKSTSQLWRIKN